MNRTRTARHDGGEKAFNGADTTGRRVRYLDGLLVHVDDVAGRAGGVMLVMNVLLGALVWAGVVPF